ncbi:unnamed protein product [Rotaria socialis]
MKHRVLLTGSTGYLGTHLVSRLLAEANVERIFCITRQKNPATFWSSLEASLKSNELSVNESNLKSKIEPVLFDLVKDRNSLLSALEPYKKTATAVHHLACETNYAVTVDTFKPWVEITKNFVEYCMDTQYPKELHSTGSYGHYLVDHKHSDEDFYWINGYFGYKKWLHNYIREKFLQGLKGVLFEPGYVVGPVDPGQLYMFWRIIRIFSALGYAFPYRMLVSPIDLVIDHYWLALNNPNQGPNILTPFIKKPFLLSQSVKDVIPDLKVIDFDQFRDKVMQVFPKRAKYFGPNMLNCMESVGKTLTDTLHPLYDYSKYEKMNQTEYLLTCRSFSESIKLGQEERNNYMKIKQQQKK